MLPNAVFILTQLGASVLSFPTVIARFLLVVPEHILLVAVFTDNMSQPLLNMISVTS
jgi:hypothetical protein